MNTRNRLLKALTLSAVATALAITIAGVTPTATAQEPSPRQRGVATFFGMQTLAPSQTAQITVVNPSEIVPCIRVRLSFDLYEVDPSSPIRLRFVRTVSRELELDPGEAASIEYTAGGRGAFVSPASFAREIDDVDDPYITSRVREQGAPGPIRTRAIAAISTLLVSERGRSILTAPGVRVGFDPQPDPPSN